MEKREDEPDNSHMQPEVTHTHSHNITGKMKQGIFPVR